MKLRDDFLAEPVDVHRLSRHEMDESFKQLRRTFRINATMIRLSFESNQLRPTRRTMRREFNHPLFPAPFTRQCRYDGRNDISCFFDDDAVTDMKIFFLYKIFIVKRRIRHGRPRHRNRGKPCPWCDLPRTTDTKIDILDRRHDFFCRELIRDGPTWTFGGKTKLFLFFIPGHFDDNPIDFIWEVTPFCHVCLNVIPQFIRRLAYCIISAHRDTESFQIIECFVM